MTDLQATIDQVFGKEPYFGMFTTAGNQAVHQICILSKLHDRDWPATYAELHKLAELEGYGEATDTMVREMVYDYLQYDTDFYV